MIDKDGASSLDLPELLAVARVLVEEVAARAADPGLLGYLDRFAEEPEVDRSAEWGLYAHVADEAPGETATGPGADNPQRKGSAASLPIVLAQVEELSRWLDSARTGLAGHTDRIFDLHTTRREVLGIPEGKTAYRNGPDYLRQTLRIHRVEAKKRVARAQCVLASHDPTSLQPDAVVAPKMPELARAVAEATMDSASVDTVAATLAEAARDAGLAGVDPDLVHGLVTEGERILVEHACQSDPETVKKVCSHWRQRFDALVNPDGLEPTDAQANAAQGLFYQGRGQANLHRWLLMATDLQHEVLQTIAADATNPRKDPRKDEGTGTEIDAGVQNTGGDSGVQSTDDIAVERERERERKPDVDSGVLTGYEGGTTTRSAADLGIGAAAEPWAGQVREMAALDPRSLAQKRLDGLVSALTGALALTSTPAQWSKDGAEGSMGNDRPDLGGGASRPQVLVTIDYQTLAGRFREHQATVSPEATGSLLSQAAYTGPVSPAMIRQLACDSDLIPIVLGGKGEVLDVGRSQRLFTRKLRRAITARDGGCAAPDCSIYAPWCEAHHIQHWEHGGPTSVDNGVLLCSHHHHAVHAGAWEIEVVDGIPWFIPARYHDPTQTPRRNHYWRTGSSNSTTMNGNKPSSKNEGDGHGCGERDDSHDGESGGEADQQGAA
ncbi:DUF222 domain-containing protein [Citricoccus parietis]|uniref:DUF222 domain-containing protein n=1 Tax=Citricoccus parietis TaxID=592307 RepID=A0ABV6F3E8_9MICC